ncbi:MAG TPA: nuclear transport factor 2 family protein [Stellaceae bacterium]|nr:nuclear transport factor 2 family protein [Stellaceae bacterium]
MSATDLQDRAAIHDLFTRYCCALDNGEVETVLDCFTADAVLKSPVVDIQGRDEIRAFAGRFAAQRAGGTQFRHMVTNIAVRIDGDRAAATAYLLVLISKDGSHRTLPPGRYECDVVRTEGVWRFARRNVFHDHAYSLEGIGDR